MSSVKTTVYLDAAEYRRLKTLAAAEGRPAAELIRTAVSDYVRSHVPDKRPMSVGAGRSGVGTLSEHDEELLVDLGQDG